MVRSPAAADESLAAILARIRLGIAIAAMIRMIATTISNSISEKPFCFRISFSLSPLKVALDPTNQYHCILPARAWPTKSRGEIGLVALFAAAEDTLVTFCPGLP